MSSPLSLMTCTHTTPLVKIARTAPEEPQGITQLPVDLLTQILSNLEPIQHASTTLVSRTWCHCSFAASMQREYPLIENTLNLLIHSLDATKYSHLIAQLEDFRDRELPLKNRTVTTWHEKSTFLHTIQHELANLLKEVSDGDIKHLRDVFFVPHAAICTNLMGIAKLYKVLDSAYRSSEDDQHKSSTLHDITIQLYKCNDLETAIKVALSIPCIDTRTNILTKLCISKREAGCFEQSYEIAKTIPTQTSKDNQLSFLYRAFLTDGMLDLALAVAQEIQDISLRNQLFLEAINVFLCLGNIERAKKVNTMISDDARRDPTQFYTIGKDIPLALQQAHACLDEQNKSDRFGEICTVLCAKERVTEAVCLTHKISEIGTRNFILWILSQAFFIRDQTRAAFETAEEISDGTMREQLKDHLFQSLVHKGKFGIAVTMVDTFFDENNKSLKSTLLHSQLICSGNAMKNVEISKAWLSINTRAKACTESLFHLCDQGRGQEALELAPDFFSQDLLIDYLFQRYMQQGDLKAALDIAKQRASISCNTRGCELLNRLIQKYLSNENIDEALKIAHEVQDPELLEPLLQNIAVSLIAKDTPAQIARAFQVTLMIPQRSVRQQLIRERLLPSFETRRELFACSIMSLMETIQSFRESLHREEETATLLAWLLNSLTEFGNFPKSLEAARTISDKKQQQLVLTKWIDSLRMQTSKFLEMSTISNLIEDKAVRIGAVHHLMALHFMQGIGPYHDLLFAIEVMHREDERTEILVTCTQKLLHNRSMEAAVLFAKKIPNREVQSEMLQDIAETLTIERLFDMASEIAQAIPIEDIRNSMLQSIANTKKLMSPKEL